ncbi:MAG: RpoL/Rpb11 RNA polymerase subunit family protein [Candidatus Hodarchaeales archaeon]|jgi:DNA-directed RNA polymerase subunit L
MEINKLRIDEKIFEFEISGEDHNYLNLLRVFLKDVDSVEIAAYRSLMHSVPVFYVRTDGSFNPIDAVRYANDQIVTTCDELNKQLPEVKK